MAAMPFSSITATARSPRSAATRGIFQAGTWSSSAAFLDHDDDGDLDLYVTRYGDWSYPRDDQFCGDTKRKIRRYCPPAATQAGQACLLPEQRRPDFHRRD